MNTKKSMLDAALQYAADGYRVLPVYNITGEGNCSCGKDECSSPGKHPMIRAWQEKASSDPKTIKKWWRKNRQANIGLLTGNQTNLIVLDIDPRNGGNKSLEELEFKHGSLPRTKTITTGGGGEHFYFQYPEDTHIKNSSGKLGEGLDIKSDNGFIIAPPSNHVSGGRYRERFPDETPAPFPDILLNLLQATQARTRNIKNNYNSDKLIEEGSRNTQLTSLAGKLRRGGADYKEILDAISKVNENKCNPPLIDREIRTIAKSISKYPTKFDKIDDSLTEVDFTDIGNAQRLTERYSDEVKYCAQLGKWLVWDGCRWNVDQGTQKMMEIGKETILSLHNEALLFDSSDEQKKMMSHFRRSATEGKIKSMLSLSRTARQITVNTETLDQHPWLITCKNGVIDLQNGELLDFDKDLLLTKMIDVSYDPDAACPKWERFLAQILTDNHELIDYIQQAVGYTLTGDISEQCLFFLYGTGRNGKSTFIEVIMALLGEYAVKAPTEMIMAKRVGSSIPNDIARLKGARLTVVTEVASGRKMNEAKVKDLTGGDRIIARYLRQEFFEFRPTHKLWMYGNHKPEIRGTDDGIWRRLPLIPFTYQVPKEEVNPNLKQELLEELPGILNWAIRGCLKWQKAGKLHPPSVVENATSEYKKDMDTISCFLDQCCLQKAGAKTFVKDLFEAYKDWCDSTGEDCTTKRSLSKELKSKGFNKKRSTNGYFAWLDLGLKETLPLE